MSKILAVDGTNLAMRYAFALLDPDEVGAPDQPNVDHVVVAGVSGRSRPAPY